MNGFAHLMVLKLRPCIDFIFKLLKHSAGFSSCSTDIPIFLENIVGTGYLRINIMRFVTLCS